MSPDRDLLATVRAVEGGITMLSGMNTHIRFFAHLFYDLTLERIAGPDGSGGPADGGSETY